MGRPHNWCSGLGSFDRILVPAPAARITAATRSGTANCTSSAPVPLAAGEPGFEPGTRAPKTPVIPFHHSPTVTPKRAKPTIDDSTGVCRQTLTDGGELGRTSHKTSFLQPASRPSLVGNIRISGDGYALCWIFRFRRSDQLCYHHLKPKSSSTEYSYWKANAARNWNRPSSR